MLFSVGTSDKIVRVLIAGDNYVGHHHLFGSVGLHSITTWTFWEAYFCSGTQRLGLQKCGQWLHCSIGICTQRGVPASRDDAAKRLTVAFSVQISNSRGGLASRHSNCCVPADTYLDVPGEFSGSVRQLTTVLNRGTSRRLGSERSLKLQ